MSLFQRPLRPPAIWSDEAVDRYLSAIREEISLDPLFRHRLRGAVVNRFVSEREGASRPAARTGARRMGTLGRSVLYASVALALSVTGTMAAAQGAIPGDALYVLKRQIETLRLEALPAHFHDDLAAHALGERIEELGRLAERGDWARVAEHAAAVAHDSDEFLALNNVEAASTDRHLVVLNGLLDRLPARVRLVIEGVAGDLNSPSVDAGAGRPSVWGRGTSNGQGDGSSHGPGSGASNGPGGGSPTEPGGGPSSGGAADGGGPARGPGDQSRPGADGPTATARPTPRAEPQAGARPSAAPQSERTPQSSKPAKRSPASTQAPSGRTSD